MNKAKILLASDHAGFELKEAVKEYLKEKGYMIEDFGATVMNPDDDYPQYMVKVGLAIASDENANQKGIIFGGSGQGEAMVANRFPGVRACVWYGGNEDIIILSRKHNDANILSLGARFVDKDIAIKAVQLWLDTPFSGEEKHKRRIVEMDSIA